MTRAVILWCIVALCGCRCDVPGKRKAEGGKYRRCAKVRGAGKGEVKAGKTTCSWEGHRGSCSPAPEGTLDLCIVAGASDDAATRSNLDAYLETCRQGEVDAVAVLGDTGRSAEEITAVIESLASLDVPVLVLPGSRESYRDYVDALEASLEAGKPVIDLSRIRVLAWGGNVLVSLPGIGNPYYLEHPGEGCAFDERDMDDLEDLIEEAREKGRVVLLSAYPPLGRGKTGIDASREGMAVGDPHLARVLEETEVLVGAFGSVYESGGLAVDPVDGSLKEQGAWHAGGLYLNPGSIEAVPWEGEAGGGFSTGQAAVLQVGESGTRYYMWRVR
jgi:Icc-related predicted phosphoesterase